LSTDDVAGWVGARDWRIFYREAELLDSNKLEDWPELLTEDISYEMPVRCP
jgi:3-phenylpropionate/cinnamic acid dioxygenase small subunit